MTAVQASRPPSRPGLSRLGHYALPAFTAVAIGYLLVPIVVMIIFSFNQPVGKFNYNWNQFSIEGWLHPFDWPGLPDSVRISVTVALVSTVFATIAVVACSTGSSSCPWRPRRSFSGRAC